jgi:hypothetical protein
MTSPDEQELKEVRAIVNLIVAKDRDIFKKINGLTILGGNDKLDYLISELSSHDKNFIELPENFMDYSRYYEVNNIHLFEIPLWTRKGIEDLECEISIYHDGRDDKYEIRDLRIP